MDFDRLLFLTCEFLSSFLSFLLFAPLFTRPDRRSLPARSGLLLLVFVAYIIGVFHFTGAGTLYEGMRFLPSFRPAVNLVPFSHHIDPAGYVLNVVLFLPLGLLTPLLWKQTDSFLSVLGVGLAFSLFLELTQLLNARATDVDDLILNAAGTLIGFAVCNVLDKATGSRFRSGDIPLSLLPLCILAPYFGRFFLYDEMGLARLLYGF